MLVSGSVMAVKWNRSNDPKWFNPILKNKIITNFTELPMKASLMDDRFGWSDSYWPSQLGGIAYRWNHPNPIPFKYKFYSKEELLNLSNEQISTLSPAELYDIAMGDYKYTLTKKVLSTYSPKDLWWEGICHGWAQAASNYPEPDRVEISNKDGLLIPFGSSDVKALLSMHDAYNSTGLYVRVGDRCKIKGKVPGEETERDTNVRYPSIQESQKPECSDVNAGSFHVILSNLIGLNSQGFVAEIDRFNDVWNQPATAYESFIVREEALSKKDEKNKVFRKIRIKTKMTYGDELDFFGPDNTGDTSLVSKDPVTGTNNQRFKTRTYEYVLELDSLGLITGGEWVSASRPDMIWMKARDKKFRNGKFPLEGLNQIYRPVVR